MNKRERQRYNSEVIIVWCVLGIGAIIMFLLLTNTLINVIDCLK